MDVPAARALCDAATPGPWHGAHHDGLGCVAIGDYGWVCAGERVPDYDVDTEQGRADAEFIAHARTGWPAALDEIERLRARIEWLDRGRDRHNAEMDAVASELADTRREASEAREALQAIREWAEGDYGGVKRPIDVWPGLAAALGGSTEGPKLNPLAVAQRERATYPLEPPTCKHGATGPHLTTAGLWTERCPGPRGVSRPDGDR